MHTEAVPACSWQQIERNRPLDWIWSLLPSALRVSPVVQPCSISHQAGLPLFYGPVPRLRKVDQQKILTAKRNADLFAISPIMLLLTSETLDVVDPREVVSFLASRFMRL